MNQKTRQLSLYYQLKPPVPPVDYFPFWSLNHEAHNASFYQMSQKLDNSRLSYHNLTILNIQHRHALRARDLADTAVQLRQRMHSGRLMWILLSNHSIANSSKFNYLPGMLPPKARENAKNLVISNVGTVRHLQFEHKWTWPFAASGDSYCISVGLLNLNKIGQCRPYCEVKLLMIQSIYHLARCKWRRFADACFFQTSV